MSHKYSTAIGAALGGAAVAAFVGMGTAHAADHTDTDGVPSICLGAPGTAGSASCRPSSRTTVTYDI